MVHEDSGAIGLDQLWQGLLRGVRLGRLALYSTPS